MANFVNMDMFANYQKYIDKEQETREDIRIIVRGIESICKEATIKLQKIHIDISKISYACKESRRLISSSTEGFSKLAAMIPPGQYYRYSDHWTYTTQRLIFLIAMITFLESGTLVTREEVANMLGLKTHHSEGFHLDIEDYLLGLLQMASELTRFATNAVTQGDYDRPLLISNFLCDLNSGFRLLNLKNDGLRKRFDALKYDIKKIEEIVYDLTIRGLRSNAGETAAALPDRTGAEAQIASIEEDSSEGKKAASISSMTQEA